MAGKLVIPVRAFNDKVVVGFMNRILAGINAVLPATLTDEGIVKLAAVSTNASNSIVSVDSADATDLGTNNTLTNEMKGDVNQLVTDVNALVTNLNDLKAKMRTAGQLDF